MKIDQSNPLNIYLIRGSFLGLHVMPPRILGGQSKKIREILEILTKSETSDHQFNISNHNSDWICYLSNKLPTTTIMKIDQSNPLNMYLNYPHMPL
jgi:hypothetical protein